MPTIEVTQEQADALARGENVTLAPPPKPRKRYIVVTQRGNVYDVRSRTPIQTFHEPYGRSINVRGACRLIAKGATSGHNGTPGERVQSLVSGTILSITEVVD